MHPINQLKNVRKAQGELNRIRRAAASVPLTPEEAEDLRQGIVILEAELEAQGLLIAKIADFVELPEDYEIPEAVAGELELVDPATDPEGIALVEAIVERKAESE